MSIFDTDRFVVSEYKDNDMYYVHIFDGDTEITYEYSDLSREWATRWTATVINRLIDGLTVQIKQPELF